VLTAIPMPRPVPTVQKVLRSGIQVRRTARLGPRTTRDALLPCPPPRVSSTRPSGTLQPFPTRGRTRQWFWGTVSKRPRHDSPATKRWDDDTGLITTSPPPPPGPRWPALRPRRGREFTDANAYKPDRALAWDLEPAIHSRRGPTLTRSSRGRPGTGARRVSQHPLRSTRDSRAATPTPRGPRAVLATAT